MPGFDLRTHILDQLTGRIVSKNLYRLHVIDRIQYFERPVNSGNLWYLSGEPAGRIVGGKVDKTAVHIEYTPPPTGAERIENELRLAREKAAAAEQELAAIKAEQKAAIAKAQEQVKKVPEKDKA